MKVMSVVGARPQFVKLAPVAAAFTDAGIQHVIVHTGQHYDTAMSDVFFEELSIPEPHLNLGVGSSSHAHQTASMMMGLEPVVDEARPDWLLTYGDTNSTLAAALVAAKLRVPTAHLEAGLRSFNRSMPEEHNRVLTDHASDLLLTPSREAMANLGNEGLSARAVPVGDVMLDVALTVQAGLETKPEPLSLPEGSFALATIHRQENTDSRERLTAVLEALQAVDMTIVLTAHPRLLDRCERFDISLEAFGFDIRPPLTYRQMIAAIQRAAAVITDSGGLQKEAYFFSTPCTTLRPETEWTETLEDGWNVLAHDLAEVPRLVGRPYPTREIKTPYGAGDAASRVLETLMDRRPVRTRKQSH